MSEDKRPRIPLTQPANRLPAIVDEMEFIKNRCTPTARKISTAIGKTDIEVWFHKHYYNRSQHGDENGKREGIEPLLVEELVLRSIKPLALFSAIVDGFSFLNHPDINSGNMKVIVIKDISDDPPLNIVVEAHYCAPATYEITVKTAMKTEGFKAFDGQYVVEIQEDEFSLKKQQKGGLKTILNL